MDKFTSLWKSLSEGKVKESIPEIGDKVKYKGGKFYVREFDGEHYHLSRTPRGKKVRDLTKVN